MSRLKVVISDYVWDSVDMERRILGPDIEVVALHTKTEDEFLEAAADCDALLNTYAGPITAKAMARMGRCKIIARYGIGVDTIDLDAATDAGIIVTNNPTYCVEEVADHTVALLLSAARKTALLDRTVRDGRWDVMAAAPMRRLSTQTLGLVGFGNIARRVATRMAAFGVAVLWYDPFVKAGQFQAPGEKVDFDTLLARADFVSIHSPLLPETRGLFNDAVFAKMRPGAILVNCARGAVVDQDSLVRALDSGRLAGAALDTTVPEPLPADHPLRNRDTVILNPHAAWYSVEAFAELQSGAPGEVARALRGEMPLHVVNRKVLGRSRAGL
ncbi:C-terminal binding protein [Nitrospirillum pindoramense]|uniref:D-3-phosphoglycerate dehydrogenase n=1 Tax=Nitrospirillum amazonense TaxID=28077 RepID=A0A560HKN5_9PROT|nr:C-terminal binding protein [Nitrospirillum amazonense]TWB45914.1 D-3-phosphoglycerate dehydrogenase [Nitrospirillum amazonense]